MYINTAVVPFSVTFSNFKLHLFQFIYSTKCVSQVSVFIAFNFCSNGCVAPFALLHCEVDSWHTIPIRLIGATAIAAFGEDERSAFYQHQCSPPDTLLTCWTQFEFSNSEQKLLSPVLTLETLLALTLFGIFRPGQTWGNICHEFPTLARMCIFPFEQFPILT